MSLLSKPKKFNVDYKSVNGFISNIPFPEHVPYYHATKYLYCKTNKLVKLINQIRALNILYFIRFY